MIKSPKFPFLSNQTKGFLDNTTNKQAIIFHLTNLFMTNPGEKISNPNYGIGIRRFLFENGVQQIVGNIKLLILDQIAIYMPYIRVNQSNVEFTPETNTLAISLNYTILETAENDVLTFEVSTAQNSSISY